MQDPTPGCRFALEANVLKIISVPQRVEVSLQSRLVVNVSRAGEDVRTDGFCGNAAVTMDLNGTDYVGLLL
jgi:hypothetical protein